MSARADGVVKLLKRKRDLRDTKKDPDTAQRTKELKWLMKSYTDEMVSGGNGRLVDRSFVIGVDGVAFIRIRKNTKSRSVTKDDVIAVLDLLMNSGQTARTAIDGARLNKIEKRNVAASIAGGDHGGAWNVRFLRAISTALRRRVTTETRALEVKPDVPRHTTVLDATDSDRDYIDHRLELDSLKKAKRAETERRQGLVDVSTQKLMDQFPAITPPSGPSKAPRGKGKGSSRRGKATTGAGDGAGAAAAAAAPTTAAVNDDDDARQYKRPAHVVPITAKMATDVSSAVTESPSVLVRRSQKISGLPQRLGPVLVHECAAKLEALTALTDYEDLDEFTPEARRKLANDLWDVVKSTESIKEEYLDTRVFANIPKE